AHQHRDRARVLERLDLGERGARVVGAAAGAEARVDLPAPLVGGRHASSPAPAQKASTLTAPASYSGRAASSRSTTPARSSMRAASPSAGGTRRSASAPSSPKR